MPRPSDGPFDAIPRRVARAEEARLRYPEAFQLLIPSLERSDPLADEAMLALQRLEAGEAHAAIARALHGDGQVPSSLRQLIDEAGRTPSWVNWTRVDRAGKIFFRAGLLGGLTLGMRSLVYGYAAPVGNKPLAFTGALEMKAHRRLAETSRFVSSVCTAGHLRPGAEGFRFTVHVRLMHAQVRTLALRDERWDREAWGLPINQHDMLATVLLFSCVFADGLKRLGIRVTEEEADDFQHLWRLVGHYLGVEAELLPARAQPARIQAEFVRFTQGLPDEDSRALVGALMNEPLRHARTAQEKKRALAHIKVAKHLCRELLDPETADALGMTEQEPSALVPGLRGTMRILEGVRHHIGPLDNLVRRVGASYWSWNAQQGLRSGGPMFVPPRQLLGKVRG